MVTGNKLKSPRDPRISNLEVLTKQQFIEISKILNFLEFNKNLGYLRRISNIFIHLSFLKYSFKYMPSSIGIPDIQLGSPG